MRDRKVRKTIVSSSLLIVLPILVFSMIRPVSADAGVHSWIVGMATTCADITTWWHSDEVHPTKALDLDLCGGGAAGTAVYYQDYGYTAAALAVQFKDHTETGSTCTGVDANIYDLVNGWYLGSIHYVHIMPAERTINAWFESYDGWNIRGIGTVAQTQPGGCPFMNPHLHQSNTTDVWALHNHDTGLPDPINPTGQVDDHWLHTLDQWW
jgi:hypothetical protein